jgi:DNA-binding MarR family transcriptional regulator
MSLLIQQKRKTQKRFIRGPYLIGPIPMAWLQQAQILGKPCLAVAIALWHYRGMRKNTTFTVSISDLASSISISTSAARRGIQKLEGTKLLKVSRPPGKKPIFTLNVETSKN